MLRSEVVITIPGNPAPKGSLRCIGGKGGRGHVLIEDNPRTKEWRSTVAGWVRNNVVSRIEPGQPIGAEITFTLDRPRSHYGTGRNSKRVKPSAPAYPVSHATGDVDKLLRLILDALQDTELLPDDCQVCEVLTRKAYVLTYVSELYTAYDVLGYPGVRIRIYPLEVTQ